MNDSKARESECGRRHYGTEGCVILYWNSNERRVSQTVEICWS